MASISATSRVFDIDELLEGILVYLSIDRLLVVKRVCTQWHYLISSSPRLQKIMFTRADVSRPVRDHNPLFKHYFQDITCADDVGSSNKDGKLPRAHLKLSPNCMRRLIHQCPKGWRAMSMFQPPCPYRLTMPSASIFDITVKFLNDADVPIMQAVEKANLFVELEADKKRNARDNLDRELRERFARVVNRRLVTGGEAVNA